MDYLFYFLSALTGIIGILGIILATLKHKHAEKLLITSLILLIVITIATLHEIY